MLYVKLLEDANLIEENKLKRKILNFIWKVKNNFFKIKEENVEGNTLLILHNINNKTLIKFSKYMKQKSVGRVCVSNELLKNQEFRKFLIEENIEVLDGRWLFKHLLIKILDYIVKCKKERMEQQEVSILANEINQIIAYNLKEISNKVKIVNVITKSPLLFKKIEKELYEKKGIILNINNNYKKSLIKSDVIFNFDYDEEELNKFSLPQKACVINLNNDIKINSKAFGGININFYEISLPQKYLKNLSKFKDFDSSILYESFIYKNTNPINILKELDIDEININFLNGINGKIRKNEYLNLSKKIAN